jgi:hypothetical protein
MAPSGKVCYGETDIRSRVVVDFGAETDKEFSAVKTRLWRDSTFLNCPLRQRFVDYACLNLALYLLSTLCPQILLLAHWIVTCP